MVNLKGMIFEAAIAGESDTGFIEPAQSSQLSSEPDETIPSPLP